MIVEYLKFLGSYLGWLYLLGAIISCFFQLKTLATCWNEIMGEVEQQEGHMLALVVASVAVAFCTITWPWFVWQGLTSNEEDSNGN